MIEQDDVILVDGTAYTLAEIKADPVLAARAIYWWRGRNQARVATIGLYEAEAQSRRSKGGRAAAQRGNRQRETMARKDERWLAAVTDIVGRNPTLSHSAVAVKVIERELALVAEARTLRDYIKVRRTAQDWKIR